MEIPKINKKYNCFDDGKIRESRLYIVIITEIIPFEKAEQKLKDLWKKETKTCHWLFSDKTDYFIKAITGDDEEQIFVRTKDNSWFGLGFLSGELDVDGSLTKLMTKNK